MQLALDTSVASNAFAAMLNPESAVAAHDRLTSALGASCKRWSPLDKPIIQRVDGVAIEASTDEPDDADVDSGVAEAA